MFLYGYKRRVPDPSTGHTSEGRDSLRHTHVLIPPYQFHLLTLHSFLASPPRFTPALQPIRTNTLPPAYRLVTPSLCLPSYILLYNVRFSILYPLSSARHVTISPCFPPRSLPKKAGPPTQLQEIAVALIASLLGGFGTVAMFCTLGVYV